MGTYLVMKNNLKRSFGTKTTYIVLLLIPFLIVASGIISTKFTQDILQIGIEHPNDTITKQLDTLDYVQYETVGSNSLHTDLIMGTYDYVIDTRNTTETARTISQIQNEQKKLEKTKQISVFERQFAMLMTAYLVIATMYATKCIADKSQGLTERFYLSGRKRGSYACGYVLSTLILVLFQVSIAVICFCLFEKDLELSIEKAMLIVFAISCIATLYGVIITLISKRDLTANITAAAFAVLSSILGGTFIAVEEMPGMLQAISWFSPVRWILELF